MLQVFFAVLALLAASVHLVVSPKGRSGAVAIVGTYLIYIIIYLRWINGLIYRLFSRIRTTQGFLSDGRLVPTNMGLEWPT